MAGTKRSHDGTPMALENAQPAEMADRTEKTSSSQIISIFEAFRDELDEHYDRRERIIKISRDITALSKKIIFALQRLRKIQTPLPNNITKETETRFTQIQDLFKQLIPEMSSLNTYRYQRNISPAIQEFIEAASFNHYIQYQKLISIDEVRNMLPKEILVTEEDYVMGLFDLTGEIMRFAVTGFSAGNMASSSDNTQGEDGERPKLGLATSQTDLVTDIQSMRSHFEKMSIPKRHELFRDYGKKTEVMQNSVEKVERAAYGILVRGSERPAGWMPDVSGVEVESF